MDGKNRHITERKDRWTNGWMEKNSQMDGQEDRLTNE